MIDLNKSNPWDMIAIMQAQTIFFKWAGCRVGVRACPPNGSGTGLLEKNGLSSIYI